MRLIPSSPCRSPYASRTELIVSAMSCELTYCLLLAVANLILLAWCIYSDRLTRSTIHDAHDSHRLHLSSVMRAVDEDLDDFRRTLSRIESRLNLPLHTEPSSNPDSLPESFRRNPDRRATFFPVKDHGQLPFSIHNP